MGIPTANMTRPIKFRAWGVNAEGERIMYPPATIQEIAEREAAACYTEAVVWMQFTGLLDKSGKEIYEGDIVEYEQPRRDPPTGKEWWEKARAPIVYEAPQFMYQLSERSYRDIFAGEHMEVIGNVYESPELLKAETN